ncbi:hypothetical protein Ade02nite_43420 [Paractinoplanes deccanensis]|uniref:Uncharacterized protein n=1 Tax=Paractinoplanes deccanensis TaxID=113561 RepID=A0ABQ3Y6S7_9ACTN|nr:hypothetical protein [Actinoplanes deccanensis]GID75701.1 hypothetical protein Ade02nite_43420 [Actinoplanes deccanensis]
MEKVLDDLESVEGDLELDRSVARAVRAGVYGDDLRPLPGDRVVTVELTGRQCQLVADSLAHSAALADTASHGGDRRLGESGSETWDLLRVLDAQLRRR